MLKHQQSHGRLEDQSWFNALKYFPRQFASISTSNTYEFALECIASEPAPSLVIAEISENCNPLHNTMRQAITDTQCITLLSY